MSAPPEHKQPKSRETVVHGDAHGVTLKQCFGRYTSAFYWEASASIPVAHGGRVFSVQSNTAPGALSGLRDALECMVLVRQLKEPTQP